MPLRLRAFIPAALVLTAFPAIASAQEPPGATENQPTTTPPAETVTVDTTTNPAVVTVEEAPKPKPPPYSLPWQLRPVTVGTGVRLDSTYAMYEDALARKGSTIVSFLSGSYKVVDNKGAGDIGVFARFGVANDSPSTPNTDGSFNFSNIAVGGAYGMKFDDFRLNFVLGLIAPTASGGGDAPTSGADDVKSWTAKRATNQRAQFARSAMDNAMWAPNDFTITPGVGFAYVKSGFTLQLEATLFYLLQVKASNPVPQPESTKLNFTSGLHAGYFIIPELSIGADLRYQRWLNGPQAIDKAEASPAGDPLGRVDTWTVAVGPRGHFKLGEKAWFRPGISYSRPLDSPLAGSMGGANYQMFQLDLPFSF